MTAFVESCVETAADSAVAAERKSRGKPRAAKLLRLLSDKKNILVTTHQHPDPDALASGWAMCALLETKLKGAKVTMAVKGQVASGINDVFVRHTNLKLAPWAELDLKSFDAIVLLDSQPGSSFSSLPPDVAPTAVIDHHRSRGRTPKCAYCDIRADVGAASSIVFSYFMDLEVPIKPDLAATLLFGIESDLAGAAGAPGDLDNIALSSLTLVADTRKLYQMRYVDLPQSYFISYYNGLANAIWSDNALMTHLETIDSLERPAILADLLLRFDQTQWALVTAIHEKNLVLSLRTQNRNVSAADVMRKLLRNLGEGGGHKAKAGGLIRLETGDAAEVEKVRKLLWKRYLTTLDLKPSKGQRLVPAATAASYCIPVSK